MTVLMRRLLHSLREATLTLSAMLGTLACTQWIAPGADSGVLGAVLALSMARSHLAGERRGRLEALVALPFVALASVGVGALLQQAPWIGAAVFVAGMAASIWIRRFGVHAQRVGLLVALPLVTILVVPPLRHRAGGAWAAVLEPLAIAATALAWVMLAQVVGRRLGWYHAHDAVVDASSNAERVGTLRPSPPVRMALQMAVALGVAFAVGYGAFPSHWRWIVLTAFLVNSGNRGRQDVVHKSALRVLGAAVGTVAALGLATVTLGGAATTGAAILACVFVGLWMRPLSYGWWALCVTLALALLQSLQPAAAPVLLWQRLAEIALGAAIGLGAAWFVLPISSVDVLRRRIADTLEAMSAALDPQLAERRAEPVVAAMRRVGELRPSFHARRRALRRWQPLQPADWIDAVLACQAPLVALVERGETPGGVRRLVGASRKAMREPTAIGPALAALRQALERPPATP